MTHHRLDRTQRGTQLRRSTGTLARLALAAALLVFAGACARMVEAPRTDAPLAPGEDPFGSAIEFDGPITITSGGTYRGHWQSTDAGVPAVTIRTSEPVVIEDAVIRSVDHLISAPWADADVTVRNVHGMALTPVVAGAYPGRFAHIEGYRRVVITNSSMVGTSGIYLNASSGGTVQISHNRARNIDGRRVGADGRPTGAVHLVQFVQFNTATDLVDSYVAWNEVVNDPYESFVEDVINTYKTSGRSGDPLRIHDNFIRGAYPVDAARGSYYGGGIMIGDAGGRHIHAYRNQVVGVANYGIAIAGGRDNAIYENRVVACGRLADGTWIASQNVGIYIWNYSRSSDWGNNVGRDNQVGYQLEGRRGDWWVPDATAWTGNTQLPAGAVPCSAEEEEFAAWQAKTASHAVRVGPSSALTIAAAR